MYSYGPPHMAKQKQDDQLEHTYSSYVRLRDVALKTCQTRWVIGRSGERGSGISVLAARHDEDVDMEKKLDGNCTRMLQAILNKSWWQHPTKQQLYRHQPPISKTIHIRGTRHVGHFWRSKDELVSDVLLCTPSHGRAKVGRPARTFIQQLCADTGSSLEDLPRVMDDRDEWQERVREIHACSVTLWWWYILTLLYQKCLHKFLTTGDPFMPDIPMDFYTIFICNGFTIET